MLRCMRTMAAWLRRSKAPSHQTGELATERVRPRWCARLAGSGSCSLVLGTGAAPNVCLATLASVLLLDTSSYHPPMRPTLESCPCPLLDPSLHPAQRQPDRKPNETGGQASLHAAWSRLVQRVSGHRCRQHREGTATVTECLPAGFRCQRAASGYSQESQKRPREPSSARWQSSVHPNKLLSAQSQPSRSIQAVEASSLGTA